MCEYFCIEFIDFMLAGKKLTDYTNIFSPNNSKKNDDIILNYFMSIHKYKLESYCVKCKKHTKKYKSTSF